MNKGSKFYLFCQSFPLYESEKGNFEHRTVTSCNLQVRCNLQPRTEDIWFQLHWCWWQQNVLDYMIMIVYKCWWPNDYAGDFFAMLVSTIRFKIGHQHLKLVTNILQRYRYSPNFKFKAKFWLTIVNERGDAVWQPVAWGDSECLAIVFIAFWWSQKQEKVTVIFGTSLC